MKKILVACGIAFCLSSTYSYAQPSRDIEIHSFSWGASTTSGSQSVPIPGGKGTVKFDKQGDKFTNVVFVDAAGKTFRLLPSQPGVNGAPNPSCKYPLPDACFATQDKTIGMCICKPTDISSGNNNGAYLIGMSIPAATASSGKIKTQTTTNPGTSGGGGH